MKFKKMMALVASTVLCVGMLAGCGSTSSSTGSQSTSSKSDKKVIGFAQVGAESGWRTAETDSIKSIPTLDSNFDLKFSDGQQNKKIKLKQ